MIKTQKNFKISALNHVEYDPELYSTNLNYDIFLPSKQDKIIDRLNEYHQTTKYQNINTARLNRKLPIKKDNPTSQQSQQQYTESNVKALPIQELTQQSNFKSKLQTHIDLNKKTQSDQKEQDITQLIQDKNQIDNFKNSCQQQSQLLQQTEAIHTTNDQEGFQLQTQELQTKKNIMIKTENQFFNSSKVSNKQKNKINLQKNIFTSTNSEKWNYKNDRIQTESSKSKQRSRFDYKQPENYSLFTRDRFDFTQILPLGYRQNVNFTTNFDQLQKSGKLPSINIKDKIIYDIFINQDEIVNNEHLVQSIQQLKDKKLLKQYKMNLNPQLGIQKISYVYNDYHMKATNPGYARNQLGGFFTK